jgi:DNA-binding LacI/PurR family transcriptional regulator
VARHAGVSIATVSRVLNGTGLVAPETAARVHAAIQMLDYHPRPAARGLASRRTDALGLVTPEIGGELFPLLLRGVEAEAHQAGYDLLIHTTLSPPKSQERARRPLAEHNTDGLLVFSNSLDSKELQRLYALGFPVVLMHQSPPEGLEMPEVTIENKNGARRLVEHLIVVHGKRHIAYLRGLQVNQDSRWRELGYREALQAHGLPYNPRIIGMGAYDDEAALEAVKALICQDECFDAIFAADDDSAVGALLALRQAGYRVPEDVALVGFDDVPFSRYLTPPLTTVRAPIEQVGRIAVRQLVALIHNEPVQPLTLLPTEVVLRSSCGCPA